MVFAAWTAEEAGLLGAEYYAANPVWPLETTVANINIDSFLPGAEVSPQIVVMGAGKSGLLRRRLLGSVSKTVLRQSKVPVLIVR